MSIVRPVTGVCRRGEFLLEALRGLATLLLAATALVVAGSSVQAADPAWSISTSSSLTVIGSKRFFTAQSVGVGQTPQPDGWATTNSIAFPQVNLGFGSFVRVDQIGTGTGTQFANGMMTLDVPLRVTDSDGDIQNITGHFTTEPITGSDNGVQICPGASTVCQGTRRNGSGAVRLVAIAELPQDGNTFVAGRSLLMEIEGTMPIGDTDGDGVSDLDDNCPSVSNAGQQDADGDGQGDACEAGSGGGTPGLTTFEWHVLTGSNYRLVGSTKSIAAQDVTVAVSFAPPGWATQDLLLFPRLNLPFSEYVDVQQTGSASGTFSSTTGAITFSMPIRVVDNYNVASNLVASFTTGATNGIEEGVAACDGVGDPSVCNGTPRNPTTGNFRVVAMVKVVGTIMSNKLLQLELVGRIDPGDTDGDGRENFADNCVTIPNSGQADGDADGVGDACDVCPAIADPLQLDTDGDGFGNVCDADTDNDGVFDEFDNCLTVVNPTQADADGDGQGDACDNDGDNDGISNAADNCPTVFNPTQLDGDADGKGNACDACPADPANDVDLDGICGNVDNCPTVANTTQANTDLDALGNVCDSCPSDPSNDVDGDGVCGNVDNCPSVSNATQSDSDGDGQGNACDACPSDAANDGDADGICGSIDNCPNLANPDQADRDGDGKGNLCDPLRVNFAPTSASPLAGFSKDDGSVFSPALGWGWGSSVPTRDRNTPAAPPELDTFAFTAPEVLWRAELANGDYDVHVVSGDASYPQGPHRVRTGGVDVFAPIVTEAGSFAQGTLRVKIRNGQLDLAVGGSAGTTMINLMEANEVASGLALLKAVSFQPTGSVVPAGYLLDAGDVFTTGRGYGWDQLVQVRERGQKLPQADDTLAFSTAPRLWDLVLPNGFYEVWLRAGDASFAAGPQRVRVEGLTVINAESTQAGQFLERHAVVQVSDGKLTVEIGGGGGTTSITQVVVATAAADADGDGLANTADNCPGVANPTQANTDADSLGNACDICPADAANDVDGDGVCGNLDNCPQTANPTQANADGDAQGDACDSCPATPSNDVDGDGVCGNVDNCPTTPNPSQADTDGDGLGDACDTDADQDGVTDAADNCPTTANPSQADTDGDGIGNACDNCPSVSSPIQTDADGDGLGTPCDPCPADPVNDVDADGICGSLDNCPLVANPNQADRDGDGLGNLCDPLRINFAPKAAAQISGWKKDEGLTYSSGRLYGWSAALATRQRTTPAPLELDTFAFTTPEQSWIAEVPNGDYDVRVACGDASYPQGPHRVIVGDKMVFDSVTTLPSAFVENTVRVPVRNGRLKMKAGGTSGATAVDLLVATEVAQQVAVLKSVNFQPATSAVPSGYLVDSGDVFTPERGHGWNQAVQVRERKQNLPQVNDTLAFSTPTRVWEIVLPNGYYDIWLTVGDPIYTQGPQRVIAEGVSMVDGQTTLAGQSLDRHDVVPVTDGRLTVQIGGAPGGGTTVLNQIVVATAAADADGDGRSNSTDNCPGVANPAQTDTDGDGIGDACDPDLDQDGVNDEFDNCPGLANPGQGDLDADGQGDPCDPDVDGDSLPNGQDNCPLLSNANQADADGDGLGNACDNCPNASNVSQSDPDGDGVGSACDNCPTIAGGQADADGDGTGDLCDSCTDKDADGFGEATFPASTCPIDNCPNAYNPGQVDADGDGLGNVCDPLRFNFGPSDSPAVPGFYEDHGAPFQTALGFGWTDGTVLTRDRKTPASQQYDTFAFTQPARTWSLELPNGDYEVRVVCGDASYPQGPHRVVINGVTAIDGVTTVKGQYLDVTSTIPVRTGLLQVTLGGTSGSSMLNFIEIVESPTVPIVLTSIHFQPINAAVPPGYLPDVGQTFNATAGYGWNTPVAVAERGLPVPRVLNTLALTSAPSVWELERNNGYYEVWLSVGDPMHAAGPHRVRVEGQLVISDVSTDQGRFLERHVVVAVLDGRLTVEVGSGDTATMLNQIVVAPGGPDVDGDAHPNSQDNCPLLPNPDQADADGDGKGDACDVDTDLDGITDDHDNCPAVANATQTDADGDGQGDACDSDIDGDGVGNVVDNCPSVSNTSQANVDGDSKGNACDACPQDAANDADGDGVCGNLDNCPSVSNTSQANVDGDSKGDACDACPQDAANDADGDGVCGNLDNCPSVSNASQANADGDTKGDACDACPQDAANDADGDGACGNVDNCPALYNPQQLDSDGDGRGNSCDNCPGAANPTQSDLDTDLVGDSCDNCPSEHNFWQQDGDFDSRGDACDNCLSVANPGQADLDGDGIGDVCDSDADGDGLAGTLDNCPSVSNASQANADGDTKGDACDACPQDAANDADGDGVCGNLDNCPSVSNASQANADGDSKGDACDACPQDAANDADGDGVCGNLDNCPSVSNASQANADGDSKGDACDACPQDAANDADGDGVCGNLDNCPSVSNASQANADGDSMGDACDVCPQDAANDADGDGVCGNLDNCPSASNASQTNVDGDSIGDACDACPQDAANDADGDGVCGNLDNCPSVSNASQANVDGDSMGDVCDACPQDAANDADGDGICGNLDNCPNVSNASQTDTDGDGIGNFCDPLRVNFAPSSAPALAGFRKDDGSIYAPARGHGWDAAVLTRDRNTSAPLELDTFGFTAGERKWVAELANGDYDVRVVSGDATYSQGPHRVLASGQQLFPPAATTAGSYLEGTLRVAVRNGRLDLTVGGSSGTTMINLLEATEVASSETSLQSINFQPSGSSVPAGYLADAGETYSSVRGFGWDAPVQVAERNLAVPQANDTLASTAASRVWKLDLPSGYYDVWLGVGDPAAAVGPQRVIVEGQTVVANESTPAGQILERHAIVFVGDGHLTVSVGGTAGTTALTQIVVGAAAPDADGDGVLNGVDNCPGVANPLQGDADLDGKGDTCDACPQDAANDADGDGVCGNGDNCPSVSNASQSNTDGDMLGDACDACPQDGANDADGDGVCGNVDNCPTVANASQINADADAQGDACDTCPQDAANDADGDGVCGNVDNCPSISNASQADQDSDGVGNACDNCSAVANPTQADPDGDGVGSACDNCSSGWNPDQANSDLDSFGDVCDNCDHVTNGSQSDFDADGVGNACDNCFFVANTNQLDLDGDGVGNSCDNCQADANAAQTDSDGDGIGDFCDACPLDATNGC